MRGYITDRPDGCRLPLPRYSQNRSSDWARKNPDSLWNRDSCMSRGVILVGKAFLKALITQLSPRRTQEPLLQVLPLREPPLEPLP